jgi:hypothetical protein
MAKRKYSKKAAATIGRKMSAMKGENRPRQQKIAIAIETARSKGLKVPKRRKKK